MAHNVVGRDIDRCPLDHLYPYRTETDQPVGGPCSRPAVGDNPLPPTTQYVCREHLRRAELLLFLNPALSSYPVPA